MAAPAAWIELPVMVVAGATPGCNASRSVKLRPFRGTAAILLPETTSPNCVSAVSTCAPDAVTVTRSLRSPSTSATSRRSALLVSTTNLRAAVGPETGPLHFEVVSAHRQIRK